MSFKTTRIKFGDCSWILYKNILFSHELRRNIQHDYNTNNDDWYKNFYYSEYKCSVSVNKKLYWLGNEKCTKEDVRNYLATLQFNSDFEDKLK